MPLSRPGDSDDTLPMRLPPMSGKESAPSDAMTVPSDLKGLSSELPTSDPQSNKSQTNKSHPEWIGPYRIIEVLGQGGMGVVYLAEQEKPLRRRVALKLIKLGMDTKEVMARFESERQALAMMDHPRIAKVFDASATETGRPYFVMEFVPGVSITQYCDTHRLATRDRLALFSEVCEALQHAHSRGVIHRDIKPSNVLVMMQDGKPVPKIIDFGVAKATEQRLSEQSVFTQHGQIVGTPEYMSPEQAEMSALDIDARTDVYSLGVVLYELLVGALPFDPKTLRRAGYAEIQRIIREVEPHKPSTRLSTMGAESSVISERRRVDNKSLQRILRGDLDWITMKALEKDRTRRYATAADIAADITRYLGNEPIVARPPSRLYRLSKFTRRHRAVVVLSSVIVFAVSVAGMALWLRHLEREARIDSLFKAAEAEFDSDPRAAEEKWREILSLNPGNADQAVVHMNLALLRKREYDNTKDPALAQEALRHLDRSLALLPSHPANWNMKGIILRNLGKYEEAVATHLEGIKTDRSHDQNWVSLANAYVCQKKWAEAERSLLEAAPLPFQEEDDKPWMRWHNLAAVRLALDKPDAHLDIEKAVLHAKAGNDNEVRLLEAKIKLLLKSADDPDGALRAVISADLHATGSAPRVKRVLALAYLRIGDWERAARHAQEAIDLKDPLLAYPLFILSFAEAKLGRAAEARKHLEAATAAMPKDLENDKIQGFIESGVLWFETFRELEKLLLEAQSALVDAPGR